MATGARGEGILVVDGREHAVLLTMRALADAERLTGKTVMQLGQAAQSQALGIGDLAALLHVGLEHARRDTRGGGRAVTINDAYRIMEQLGFSKVAGVVLEAFAAVLSYDPDDEAEGADDPPD